MDCQLKAICLLINFSLLHTQDTTVNLPDEDGCVVVPRVPCQVLLYSNTIHIVGQHLLLGCNDCSV